MTGSVTGSGEKSVSGPWKKKKVRDLRGRGVTGSKRKEIWVWEDHAKCDWF